MNTLCPKIEINPVFCREAGEFFDLRTDVGKTHGGQIYLKRNGGGCLYQVAIMLFTIEQCFFYPLMIDNDTVDSPQTAPYDKKTKYKQQKQQYYKDRILATFASF